MKNLNNKAFLGLLCVLLVMAGLLFLFAGTIDYWQAWIFLAIFGTLSLAITLYLMKKDPKLLERRIYGGPTAEKERSQRIIQSITSVAFITLLVLPALDHRFHWSTMSPYTSLAGDALVAIGFLIVFFVYRENTFASAIIEIAPEQRVISTGPYGMVRHPMYAGGLIWLVGMSLALGSWWGLFVLSLITPALIWRIIDEEKFLAKNLSGYSDYCQKVRFRLLPFVW